MICVALPFARYVKTTKPASQCDPRGRVFMRRAKQQNPLHSVKRVLFEVWVSSDAMPEFKLDKSLPRFDFYEGADLTALGRPLKIDRQITPPFQNRGSTMERL